MSGHSASRITSDLYTHIFEKVKREAMDRMGETLMVANDP